MFRITMLGSPLVGSFVQSLVRAAPLGVRCFTEGPPSGGALGGGRQSSGPRVCYNCGEEGHMSFDCPKPRKERGPPRDRGMGGGGYGDRRSPSSSSFREQRGPMTCYNCGQEGHLSRDCTAPRKERRDPSTVTCYNCGEAGHISTACTQPRKERTSRPPQDISQVKCYNCSEMGHYSGDCPQPRREQRAPRAYGGGGGGGGGRGGYGGGYGGGGGGGGGGGRGPPSRGFDGSSSAQGQRSSRFNEDE